MKGQIAKGKKKVGITLTAKPYEELQGLVKEMGWPLNWLSLEFDKIVQGLLVVAKQAKQDALNQKEMTEAEAKKRYEEIMRKVMED
jgi:hypothetical protein